MFNFFVLDNKFMNFFFFVYFYRINVFKFLFVEIDFNLLLIYCGVIFIIVFGIFGVLNDKFFNIFFKIV